MNNRHKVYLVLVLFTFATIGSWYKNIITFSIFYGGCNYFLINVASSIFKSEIPNYNKFIIIDYMFGNNLLMMVNGILPIYIFDNEIYHIIIKLFSIVWMVYVISINISYFKEKRYIELYSNKKI